MQNFLRKELPNPRLKYRDVVGPDGCVAQSGTNTWIPEDVVFPAAGPSQRVVFRYEVRVEGQGEVIGGLSRSRARFGTGAEDALTWYLAPPQRHRFGFRTRMFDNVAGLGPREEITLVPGQWHSVMMVLAKENMPVFGGPGGFATAIKAYYYLDGRRVHTCLLSVSGTRIDPVDRWGVPGQRFGMVTYDTSYSWRNATISYR